jgi:excisionase family DNA binding protein
MTTNADDDAVPGAPARVAEKLLLRPEEAADVLGIGRSKLYELLATGAVESVFIGSCRRIPVEVLHDYVRRLRAAGIVSRPTAVHGSSRPKDSR